MFSVCVCVSNLHYLWQYRYILYPYISHKDLLDPYVAKCVCRDHAGLKFCKMNVHMLSHLPYYVKVKLFGPLWTQSAFAFEDCIGHLVQKAHGTHDIANQVYSNDLYLLH